MTETAIGVTAIALMAGALAQAVAARLGLPSIVLLLATGVLLGPEERISVAEAIHAITLGAAHQLKRDDEVGSISPHKHADLAILEEDRFTIDPVDLRDVPVWGTMLGGRLFPAD